MEGQGEGRGQKDGRTEDPSLPFRGTQEGRHDGRQEYRMHAQFEKPGPELGQHSTEILRELNYSEEKIAELKAYGTIK